MIFGLEPERFWLVTPREAQIEIKAAIDRKKHETKQRHVEQKWMAWNIAALGRVDQKHFPKLSAFLDLKEKGKKDKTWQEQFAKTMAWAEKSKK